MITAKEQPKDVLHYDRQDWDTPLSQIYLFKRFIFVEQAIDLVGRGQEYI